MRRPLGYVLACGLFCALLCSDGSTPLPSTDTLALDAQIAAWRDQGAFEDALRLAQIKEQAFVANHAAPWRAHAARYDVATLKRLCTLPDTARTRWQETAQAVALTYPHFANGPREAHAARLALERRRAVCERGLGPESAEVATVLGQLAAIEEAQNDMGRAYDLDSQALAIRTKIFGEPHPGIAESLDRLSLDLKQTSGADARVMALCERAIAMRRECSGEWSGEHAASLLRRANFRRVRMEMKLARSDFARAEEIFARTDGPASRRVAEVLTDHGLTLVTEGDWGAALPLLQRALEIRRGLGGPPDDLLVLTLNQAGVVLRELGRLDEAKALLRESVAAQEARWRAAAPGRGLATRLPLSAYRELAVCALRQGQWTEAWEALERFSSRVSVDVAIARGELDATHDPWDGLLPRVQRAMPDSAAMIGWLDTRYGGKFADWPSWCFVVTKSGAPQWFRVDAPDSNPAPLQRRVREFMGEIQAVAAWPLRLEPSDQLERSGRDIYQLRIAPMEPALAGVRTLIIASPEMNYGVPVEALVDGEGRFVAERFVTEYCPSALLYANAREHRHAQRKPWQWRGLLVGSPAGSAVPSLWPALPPLHNAAHEIRSIADGLQSADVFTGRAASEAALDSLHRRGQLSKYDFIHFATHAEHDDQWFGDSALLLAEAQPPGPGTPVTIEPALDGRLSIDEIGDRWHLNAQLVSLAACQGFSQVLSVGDGPMGIGAACLQAGARSLLVSCFPVDDAASELFFNHYASLLFARNGPAMDAATALRAARLWLRDYRAPDGSRPYRSPAFWSGYLLVGWPD